MAVVHPSRANLVPVDSRALSSSRDEHDKRNSYHDDRTRSRSRERSNRKSPEYADYRDHRQREQSERTPNQSNGESMYPPRRRGERSGQLEGRSEFQGRQYGNDYFESRRQQRESSTINIWPPSPKASRKELDDEDSHNRRRRRARSVSSDTDDSDDRERRKRRRKRKEKRKERSRRHRTRSPSTSSSSSSGDERDRKRRRKERNSRSDRHYRSSGPPSDDGRDRRGRTRSHSKDRRRSTSRAGSVHSDDWVEKETSTKTFVAEFTNIRNDAPQSSILAEVGVSNDMEQPSKPVFEKTASPTYSDDDTEMGPQPLVKSTIQKVNERQYGSALLRGEGSAMAAFLAEDTNARIPRRGEIGLESDQIEAFETAGYVMSGSRHRRMNAVRIRKENQVISAEEKRGILKLQKEERTRREAILREEFKELVSERLKSAKSAGKEELEGPK